METFLYILLVPVIAIGILAVCTLPSWLPMMIDKKNGVGIYSPEVKENKAVSNKTGSKVSRNSRSGSSNDDGSETRFFWTDGHYNPEQYYHRAGGTSEDYRDWVEDNFSDYSDYEAWVERE